MTKIMKPHDEIEIAFAIEETRRACAKLLNLLDDNAATTPLKKRQGREGERTDRVLEAMGALRSARALTNVRMVA